MSKAGKESKIGRDYIPDLVLIPEEHTSLDEDSIVERKVRFGKQKKGEPKPQPLFPFDFEATDDNITESELKKIREGVQNDTEQHRETYERTIQNWKKHFKK